jgi:signal transduction histidine kinase
MWHRSRRLLPADASGPLSLRRGVAWWEPVVAVGAVLAGVAAVWVTLEADFLAFPGWLAAQKADLILGPVFIGLYWRRVRPGSRFWPLLIACGAVGALYTAQSSSDPWLFGTGLVSEAAIYVATLVLILTFPTGRLDGMASKLILLAAVVVALPLDLIVIALLPQLGPDGSISGCRGLCPDNGLVIAPHPSLAIDLYRFDRVALIAIALATGALLVWRMVTGTPPQRRALAIGTPIALLFTAFQIAYQFLRLVDPDATALHSVIQWALAGVRSMIWYGFLLALIAAQLFAGRALHSLLRQLLRRPTQRELEALLRKPLGDPRLQLMFRDPRTGGWTDADGRLAHELSAPASGRAVTLVERDGKPAIAILHDAQLSDDPELLQAAGASALLAAENATLEAAWSDALLELRRSRARIVSAADNERRKLERDLHDGVQQRLIGVRIKLAIAGESGGDADALGSELDGVGEDLDEAIDELREVAHGLYPPVLSRMGLLNGLQHVSYHTTTPVAIDASGIGRHAVELESAVYYCCLEAIQNATKHGGAAVHVSIALREDDDNLIFEVTDDGSGFDPSQAHGGTGLQNMRDRVGALDGNVSIVTAMGEGTTVSGSIPLPRDDDRSDASVVGHVPDERDGQHAARA